MLNDYTYQQDPDKADDSRWVHRPKADAERYAKRKQEDTIPGRIYSGIKKLVQLRKNNPILSGAAPEFIYTGNPHVFGYLRQNGEKQVLFINNFSDDPQSVSLKKLHLFDHLDEVLDIVSGNQIPIEGDFELDPFQFVWLQGKINQGKRTGSK
jgi:amylosucrase